MAENSSIEWTDHTFNPWIGCTKVSPGCKHCYAESFAKRYGKAEWGQEPLAQRHPRTESEPIPRRYPSSWSEPFFK